MDRKNILLTEKQLGLLSPFFLLIGKDMQIEGLGSFYRKYPELTEGNSFSDFFDTVTKDFSALKAHSGKQITIRIKQVAGEKLTGQLAFLSENDQLLFIASGPPLADNSVENQLRMVLDKLGDNVWEHDFRDDKTIFTNAENQFFGYDTAELVRDTTRLLEIVYKDDLNMLFENDAKYKEGLIDSHALEYRIVGRNGNINWVLDRGVAIEKDTSGKAVRIVGTHTDITRIKQTEMELEQRVKQFKSLSENIPGVIYEYVFRPDGTEGLTYVSPAIERIFGIKPADFYDYKRFIHPDDLNRVIQKNGQCRSTLEPFYDESRLVIPGKGTRWHAVHSALSYIGQDGAIVYTGFMNDITERKNIERNLLIKEEKYRSIISNMNLGLLEVDNHGFINYANQGFCNMSGYSNDELIGKEASTLFASGEFVGLLEEKRKAREQGIADAYELKVENKSGEPHWWLVSGAPRYNDDGELVGSIGIHLDITDQKHQESDLIKARVQAEQLARTREIFLANMSHEIRTPMNAIMGMSTQLAKSKLSSQQQFYLDIIRTSADNLLVIINDILDISKIEAGKLTLENIGFDLKEIVIKAMRVLAHRAEEKGLRLTNARFDKRIAHVLIGDPFRINQVLLNLMGNAVKFTEKGSIDISAELISNSENSQVIKVTVTDSGIGMDKSYIAHLFDKFSQEYESITRTYGGTGLGMSISKDLVELMGGEINVESEKGSGTKVSFTIIAKKGTFRDLPEKQSIKINDDFLAGKKIMVADDNDMNRLVASIFLENYGAEIIKAANGLQAVDMFRQYQPDLVLMDIQMPGLNGLDATKMIRRQNEHVPVIALTANAIKGENEKCLAAGMNDYVSKPFKEEELLKTIANWLGKEISVVENLMPAPAEIPERQLYDLTSLKAISRGNNAFVDKMVSIFCEQTPPMVKEMTDAYYAGDLNKMAAVAHKIKPSIDNLNILTLRETIRAVEDYGKQKSAAPELPDILNNIAEVIDKVVGDMKRNLSTNNN